MGNVCGCVRVPKEESYVDPKKAPLRPESKELKGRRYFQRNKRKSDFLQPVERLHNPECEAVGISVEVQNDPGWNGDEDTHLSRQENLRRRFNVGEVPVFMVRDSQHQPHKEMTPKTSTDSDESRSTVDKRLHDISTTSMVAPDREALLAKELMCPQLRRFASFGAVEHTLMLGYGSRNEQTFANIGRCQANRRRRPSSCPGYKRNYPVSADHKVNL